MTLKKKNLIYLTGFMGSGKSTIAPILANTLGFSYFDIDKEIEALTSKKITEVFSDFGEEYFRELEHNLLLSLSNMDDCIVSLGGGTIANQNNLEIIKTSGILVYLRAKPEFILKRLKYKTDRPLIKSIEGKQLSEEQLLFKINQLLKQREPYYAQADIVINTDDKAIGITVDQLVRELRIMMKKIDK